MVDAIDGVAAASVGDAGRPRISFVIKTLNEESKIAACIESVFAAAKEVGHPCEVIVADSVSRDRTVEIACRYPVRVVQLRHADERGCGAGVQLGYQHSRGDLVFLLDGDMVLCRGFLPAAMARLADDPQLAGVAGLLIDTAVRNTFDHYRVVNAAAGRAQRERSLGGGGLYRRSAIEACGGYAGNRNLKGWEEAELGMRLTHGGWALERIGVPAVMHTGHSAGTTQVLGALWSSRRAMASGVLLKQAMRRPWFGAALRMMVQPLLVLLMWLALLGVVAVGVGSGAWWPLSIIFVLVLGAIALFGLHKRSLRHALTSFALWHFHAASIVIGLFEPTVPPTRTIDSVQLASPEGA